LVERPHVVAAGAGIGEAELLDELAFARELQDLTVVAAVAADEQVALAVGCDAVVALWPLEALARTAPRLHEVAFRIELEHRRRGHAALRLRRIRGGINLLRLERAGAAMNDVDVIVLVDADADDVAEYPVVRHRLRPHRIDFEARRLRAALGLRFGRLLEQMLPDAQRREQRNQRASNDDVARPFHRPPSMAAHSILPRVTKTRHGSWPMAKGIWSMADGTLSHLPYAISHQPSAIFSLALAVALLALAGSAPARAHDIPNDVTVQTFVKPDGSRLRVLVRVPLQAMRDMDYP